MTDFTPAQKAAIDATRLSMSNQEAVRPSMGAGFNTDQLNAIAEARSRADYAADPSTLKDVARGGASGLTEGTASLLGLPRMAGDAIGAAGNRAMEKAGVSEDWRNFIGGAARTAVGSIPGFNTMVLGPRGKDISNAASNVTGGYTDYTPQTFAGSATKEVGNLVPAALAVALTGGTSAIPEALLYGAAIPGVLGAGAEKGATFGAETLGLKNPELYGTGAKFLTELASPSGVKNMLGAPSRAIGRQALEAEKNLKNTAGINLSVGQLTHDPAILQREASSMGFPKFIQDQHDKVKTSVFKRLGFDDVPTRKEFDAAKSTTGAAIEDAITTPKVPAYAIKQAEVDSVIQNPQLMEAINHSGDATIKDSLTLMVKRIGSGTPLSAAEINKLRSDAWALSSRGDINSPAKTAAIAMGNFFDGIIANRLKDAGQFPALIKYKSLRQQYANFVLADGAIAQSGLPSRMTFSPADLYIASRGVPGADPKLTQMAEDSVSYLLQHSPGEAARASSYAERLANDLGNIGMTSMASPIAAGIQTGLKAGNVISKALHPFAMTKAGQAIMRNLARPPVKTVLPSYTPAITSALGDIQQNQAPAYKRGGRVSSHDAAANQLVLAAERAKKGWNAQTEPLLNQSDETVVKALEVANRSI